MMELFVEGGVLFMSIVTIGFILVLAATVRGAMLVFGENEHSAFYIKDQLAYIKAAGLFAVVCGVFGQMIGLFQAFKALEHMGSVSTAMLAGGLKVSSITTLYGLFVYLIALLSWLVLTAFAKKGQ